MGPKLEINSEILPCRVVSYVTTPIWHPADASEVDKWFRKLLRKLVVRFEHLQ